MPAACSSAASQAGSTAHFAMSSSATNRHRVSSPLRCLRLPVRSLSTPLNVAVRAKGLQIGLVNYYKEKLDGFQLGLVNANPDTKVQMMFFGGNTTKLNLAARFKNKLFYTILGGGTHFLDFSDKFSGALFYRAGLELPVCKQLFISGDLGYQHVETFKNKDYGFPARLYSLQTRINLEYRLTAKLGVFVTGGYGWDRYYNRNANFDKGAIVEGGVVLFKY